MTTITIVNVPGYTNAGPQHWQTIIENKYRNVVRVQQDNWENPVREQWITGVNNTVTQIEGKVILVGHSCGAVAITQWAVQYASTNTSAQVIGALLVAPADIDADTAIKPIQVQRPLPKQSLPFPTILAYSDNDDHTALERSIWMIEQWGSHGVLFKGAGHFHTEAGFGEWPAGEALINELAGFDVLLPR
ncbi:alpha/beta hydrolase [Motilimonas cestriensis]|uniref:Alpha/beta hydrolase n=1 Tax=Motilimonas cestriensis TaxID=2742685 RepID=A0ABS8WC12_9GAMM|nr:alpha/beta hydrolase [Motilimonas cestriensis]MCE2595647.1 alpha/beta hydrolase [Motilimonas cestriensis]